MANLASTHSHGAMAAAQATANPIIIAVVKTVEQLLNAILDSAGTDPNVKALIMSIEAWINGLLGVGNAASSAATMHATAQKIGPAVGLLIKLLESLLGGFVGNPAMLQAILAWIQSILGGLPTPKPTP